MAYLLGHLSSVATHAIIEPFIDQWAWSQNNADRGQFVTQIDAQIAKDTSSARTCMTDNRGQPICRTRTRARVSGASSATILTP